MENRNMSGKTSPPIQLLVDILDQAYDRKAWHGTNLKGAVRGLSEVEAAWRPAEGRHNIWEIVVHAAYWKYIVRRRLSGEKRGSFPVKGSNWFARPAADGKYSWNEDLRLLEEIHQSLRDTILGFPARMLVQRPAGSKVSNIAMIYGVSSHDLYHAGQIQLLKRLRK
jgi:uncharacterized damage-inducible protein DinB